MNTFGTSARLLGAEEECALEPRDAPADRLSLVPGHVVPPALPQQPPPPRSRPHSPSKPLSPSHRPDSRFGGEGSQHRSPSGKRQSYPPATATNTFGTPAKLRPPDCTAEARDDDGETAETLGGGPSAPRALTLPAAPTPAPAPPPAGSTFGTAARLSASPDDDAPSPGDGPCTDDWALPPANPPSQVLASLTNRMKQTLRSIEFIWKKNGPCSEKLVNFCCVLSFWPNFVRIWLLRCACFQINSMRTFIKELE